MRMRRLLIARAIMSTLVGVLAVVAFLSGEEIFGALLAGFAIANFILIAVFTRARVRIARRPPEPPARRPH